MEVMTLSVVLLLAALWVVAVTFIVAIVGAGTRVSRRESQRVPRVGARRPRSVVLHSDDRFGGGIAA